MDRAELNSADLGRISRAIESAEKQTSGEIFVVVARRADDYRLVPVLWASVAALVLVWPLFLFTSLGMGMILFVQAAIFALWCMALTPDAIRLSVVPGRLAASNAERAAREQFLSHGIHTTKARTGVLIYAALLEHRVEIVADDGIVEKVAQDVWDRIADTIVAAARAGDLGGGLVQAVEQAGVVLSEHFPPQANDRNELPNRVVEL